MFEGEKHDGVSPIIFEIGKNALELRTQFHQLWVYLNNHYQQSQLNK